MTEVTKAWLIVGLVALVFLAGGLALWLVRGGPDPATTAEDLYQRTINANDSQELLAAVKQSPDLECDEFLRYNELMSQYSGDLPDPASELTFAELLSIGFRTEMKERECLSQPGQFGDSLFGGVTTLQQRNTQRRADIVQITSAVNDYISTRNQLPGSYSDIAPQLDSRPPGLEHYQPDDINPAQSLNQSTPAQDGDFPTHTPLADTPLSWMIHHDGDGSEVDIVVVMLEASCSDESDQPDPAGIRQLVVLYRLEGQTEVVCQDV